MIERRLFQGHPLVRQTVGHEVHQVTHILLRAGEKLREPQARDAFNIRVQVMEVGVGEVAAAGIEFHDVAQGG